MPPIFTAVTYDPDLDSDGRFLLSGARFGTKGGGLSGLRYSSVWPGGDSACSFNLDLSPWFNTQALSIGRRLVIYAGATAVWHGILDDPQRGSPWTVSAVGLGPSCANAAACVFSTSPPPAVLPTNDAVDQAISRGALRWRRTGNLPDPSATPPDNPGTIGDYFNLVAASTGQQWGVFADANLVWKVPSTTPRWLIDAVDTPGGRSLGDFWTQVVVRYLDNATNPAKVKTVTATNGVWAASGVVVEKMMDLTGHGPITAGTAASLIANVIPATAPAPVFTGGATVHRGHVRSLGGAQGELAMVRAGSVSRFAGVEPDPYTGGLSLVTQLDLQLGEVEYEADGDSLAVTPLGATARDLESIVAGLEARRLHTPLGALA